MVMKGTSPQDLGFELLDREAGRSFLEMSLAEENFKEGEVVRGRVLRITPDHVLVDIGYKSEGFIPLWEFRGPEGLGTLKEGEDVSVFIESIEDQDGFVVLSKERADQLVAWDEIARVSEKDSTIEGVVVGKVKGGLSVDIGVKAFLPGSQIDLRPVKNLDDLLGKRFTFKIIKFNKKRGNIVLSRRALLEQERESQKNDTLAKLREGLIIDGVVKNITDYGAFIDLRGIDGLLHITDMSWGRINHPSELMSIGQQTKVKVLKFDRENERVSLGLKQITPDPWQHAPERYPVGNQITGRVVSLTDYGAFVELEQGVEGLVHISEMSWTKRIKHPSALLKVGDEVNCIVLDIDPKARRISLGIKQTEPNPWDELVTKYPSGTRIKATIKNITDFGLFVGVEEGIDGLIHISDLSWTVRLSHPNELFGKGQEIEAVVLNVDKENERFSLGRKQLHNDPWPTLEHIYKEGRVFAAQVTAVTKSGVIAQLEAGIDGFIPEGETADKPADDLTQVFQIGQGVSAMITTVDPQEHRIVMSIRKAAGSGEAADVAAIISRRDEAKSTLGDMLKEQLATKDKNK